MDEATEKKRAAELDAKVDAAFAKYGKSGGIDFSGHMIVFRKPTRDQVRNYRRTMESADKIDAMDQLAQSTIVSFDDQDDPNAARVTFTTVFLEEFPMAVSNGRFNAVLSSLAGLTETEETEDLGKGLTVRSSIRKPSLTDSPNGSDASSTSGR